MNCGGDKRRVGGCATWLLYTMPSTMYDCALRLCNAGPVAVQPGGRDRDCASTANHRGSSPGREQECAEIMCGGYIISWVWLISSVVTARAGTPPREVPYAPGLSARRRRNAGIGGVFSAFFTFVTVFNSPRG